MSDSDISDIILCPKKYGMNAKYTTIPAGCAWMCEDVRGMCGDVRGCADSMLDVRLVFQVFELKHDFCGHVQKIAELDDGNMLFAVILDVF